MSVTTLTAQAPNLSALAKTSVVRLYDPATQGNSFALDGFPALVPGKDWMTRLVEIIETQGALSMTTNQTLFRQLTDAGALDERLKTLKAQGLTPEKVYWTLYNEAATTASQIFSGIHRQWPWEGRVSQEASALLTDLKLLVQDVQRISQAMKGMGGFTKIPNVQVGPQVIREAVAAGGVSPNITLVFSDRHYVETVQGYLLGLQDRIGQLQREGVSPEKIRQEISAVYSVNSLFVSRLDRVVDLMIQEPLLKGKVAVAHAKKIYQLFRAIFLGEKFPDPEGLYQNPPGQELLATVKTLETLYRDLKPWGAHPQRLLIASTGVKSDQPYPPLLYVLPFLGPWVVNTMPEGTLAALSRFVEKFSDAQTTTLCRRSIIQEPLPAIPTESSNWDEAILMTGPERKTQGIGEMTPDQILKKVETQVLNPQGNSLRAIGDTLRDKGAASFTSDEQATLQAIQTKLQSL